ncbi:N-glycosidase Npun_R5314 isoform X2 [Aplysia californica]|uniref:N-glycosidase Npun_R5314 isoform X2 n=1 Tax=Aplysia californica TaxID=6500 RepID=A0ABM1VYC5_APLCA|nr:N-glycosidase Npun_R5314 isoform X2 [Aplysia californica]
MAEAIVDVSCVSKSLNHAKMKFEFFWKKDSPFSQFHGCLFEVDGQRYTCAEQYMMHQKADHEIATQILKSIKPPQMKSLGRKVKNYDDDVWEKRCFEVVKTGNRHKFSQHKDLKQALFATRGKILVEASPSDNKWGIGLAESNPQAWDKSTWRGRNLLGYALTEVRDELMREEGML